MMIAMLVFEVVALTAALYFYIKLYYAYQNWRNKACVYRVQLRVARTQRDLWYTHVKEQFEQLTSMRKQVQEMAERIAGLKLSVPGIEVPDHKPIPAGKHARILGPSVTSFISRIQSNDAQEATEQLAQSWADSGMNDEQILEHLRRGEEPAWI